MMNTSKRLCQVRRTCHAVWLSMTLFSSATAQLNEHEMPIKARVVFLCAPRDYDKIQNEMRLLEQDSWTPKTLEQKMNGLSERLKFKFRRGTYGTYLCVSNELLESSEYALRARLVQLLQSCATTLQAVPLWSLPADTRNAILGALSQGQHRLKLGVRQHSEDRSELYLMVGCAVRLEIEHGGKKRLIDIIDEVFPYPKAWGSLSASPRPTDSGNLQETSAVVGMLILYTRTVSDSEMGTHLNELIDMWKAHQEELRKRLEEEMINLNDAIKSIAQQDIGTQIDAELGWNDLSSALQQRLLEIGQVDLDLNHSKFRLSVVPRLQICVSPPVGKKIILQIPLSEKDILRAITIEE